MPRTLTQKVLYAASVLLLIIAASAWFTIDDIMQNRAATRHLIEFTIPRTNLLADLNTSLNSIFNKVNALADKREAGSFAEIKKALGNAQAYVTGLNVLVQKDAVQDNLSVEQKALQERRNTLVTRIQQQISELDAAGSTDTATVRRVADTLKELEQAATVLNIDSDALLQRETTATSVSINQRSQRSLIITPIMFSLFALLTLIAVLALRQTIIRPLKALSTAATGMIDSTEYQVVAVTNNDEVGDLQQAFNQMVLDLREQRAAIEARNTELEQSIAKQRELLATVEQMAAPLLPIMDGIVVLPLVGHVDSQRANAIMQTLLHGVAQQRASTAILDITGLAVIDTYVVKLLLQAVHATELLGTKVIVAGISAAMAQTMVQQGVSLGNLLTYRNLRSAINAVALAPTS